VTAKTYSGSYCTSTRVVTSTVRLACDSAHFGRN
jgi:hypothetical protein